MSEELNARISVNLKTMEVTGIEIKANSKPAKAVMKQLSDENPNIIQCTDDGECEYTTVRFAGKEFKRKDDD